MADLLTGGPPDRRPRRTTWLLAAGVILAAGGAVAALWYMRVGTPETAHPRRDTTPATAAGPGPSAGYCDEGRAGEVTQGGPSPGQAVGLVIDGASPGTVLDRRDASAATGPLALVVRRLDGSLGRHGAVVTFPVDETPSGRSVTISGASGRATPDQVVWPVAGGYARVRGDLGEPALVAIASATQVVANRPVVHLPSGFRVASTGPYRSPHIREVRYEGGRLGTSPTVGGLVYTGVASLAGFEDQLYAMSDTDCGTVHGQPVIVSTLGGGNGTLAWQIAPGLVGYVGYSGGNLSGNVVRALHGLAEQTRPLDARQWQAIKPQVIDQRNDFG